MIKPIAYTCGEPAGIGLDLALLASQPTGCFYGECDQVASPVLVLGDYDALVARAKLLGIQLDIVVIAECQDERAIETCLQNLTEWFTGYSQTDRHSGQLLLIHVPCDTSVRPAALAKQNARHVMTMLALAAKGALKQIFSAIVTGPVQKSVLAEAGYRFSGHTEFFQEAAGVPRVVMMLAGGSMRVALASTHLPLKDVSTYITKKRLDEVITILIAELQSKFGLASPRIVIAGLNPHAGENGQLGTEEIDTIGPAIEKARAKHPKAVLTGPLPADTLFTPKYLKKADAVLAMYHDQGLPVLKYQSFGNGANITLGLPFIRTSVDHGTALDLAGSGNISDGSLVEAVRVARSMISSTQII